METKSIRIDDIKVIGNHRPIVKKKLRIIADSMAKIGLKTRITVRATKEGYKLVTGRHRLEAAKSLSWREIDCFVMAGDKIEMRLWAIAENLHRAELTALQRAACVKKWERLVTELDNNVKTAQPGGRQPEDKGISKTAKELGMTREGVRRARTVASISTKAKKTAKAKGIADNQSALLEVAKEPTAEAQVRKVHQLAKWKRAGKRKLSSDELKQFKRLKRTFDEALEFKAAVIAASQLVRDEFFKKVLSTLTDDDDDDEWLS